MKRQYLVASALLFGCLAHPLQAGGLQQYLEAETLQGVDGDPKLVDGLTFYADFEDSLRPLIAKTWPKPITWNAFRQGIAGKGVYVAKDETPAPPSYPTKENIPYLKGSLSFWFCPAWGSPKETGQQYLHLLSMYNPGRFYLMLRDTGLLHSVSLAEAGRFGPHWLNAGKFHYYQGFAGGEVRLQWKKGEWNHFLFTWDETESHGYLNGEEVGSGGPRPEKAGKDNYFGEILQVGGYQAGRCMNGSVDELAAWNRILTPREVKQVHAYGRAHVSFLPKSLVERLRSERVEALRTPEVTVPNVFRNGSFEAGLSNYYYATNPYFAPPKFFPKRFAITDEAAKHGKRSLRVTIPARGTVPNVGHYGEEGRCLLQTFGLQLNPKQTFTFSCWVKRGSGDEIKFSMSCYPVGSDRWGGDVEGSLLLAQGETDWQRLVFTSQPQEVAHRYYTLSFTAKHADEGEAVFYLDGLQVSPGEEPSAEEAFPCRTSVAGTLTTPVLANIFKRGKGASQLNVQFANQAAQGRETKATLSVYDLFDRKAFEQTFAVTLEPFQRHSATCLLPELAFGSYRAVLATNAEDGIVLDEMPFSVMPDLGRVDCVGVHAFLDEYSLDVAARFGARWNRLWDGTALTHWSTVQPDGPAFRWELADANLARIHARGFRPLGVLYHINEWKRSWVTGKAPVWIYEKLGSTNRGSALLGNAEMMELWKQYVHETVKRYKGKIDYWEVLNEPYNAGFGDWSPQEYMQILEITEGAIRKANPDAKVVAPCTYLSPKWCPPMLEAGLLEHLDVFSYHGYSMESSALETMQKWSTYDGKDRPCFDTENGCHGASKFFCKSYAGRDYSAGREPLEAAAKMSQAILRARAHGTDVVFQYWMRPYEAYSRHGSILYCDGTPAPSAVAFGITGWMLRGRKEHAMLRLGEYVDCALFEDPKDGSGLAAIWDSRPSDSDPESRIVLEPGQVPLQAYDLMGNPREFPAQGALRVIRLHTDPVYLKASSIQDLKTILSKALVTAKQAR